MMYRHLPRRLRLGGVTIADGGIWRSRAALSQRTLRYLVPRHPPQPNRHHHANASSLVLSSSASSSSSLFGAWKRNATQQQQERFISFTQPMLSQEMEYEGVPPDVAKLINTHAKKVQTPVSLQALMRTGRGEFLDKHFEDAAVEKHTATELVLMQVASFLRRELPIRLAHRIQDLEKVPLMKDMQSVKEVKQLYIQSFLELLEFDKKIVNADQEAAFSRLVEGIYERHSRVLVQMAKGAYEFRNHIAAEKGMNAKDVFAKMEETHDFLDRFYLCRIGIRVLIGQYLALRQPPVDHYVGIICSVTSPYEIVKRAIDDAAFMCTRKYGDAPEVIMSGRLDLTFPYVPTHLHYIMLELLKNSMRATVEWHGPDADFPPIKVIIADGSDNEDVVIKVSDEGGGIPRSNVKKIWSYLFTTADPSIQEGMVGVNNNEAVDHGIDSPLAGLGYGLPISRSYCRYFGGDLSIMSMEGYGTDAFVYLARLGNSKEPVPI
ncbi:two component system sensor histidine kinase [Nitzschia inconspicua]|uniref:Protein-serine/threonine kinase n=1 Tax=Nitzschia inconspicua TaxID=303405 RepID=A0A9K3KPH9_9STRA|nr:two component system sensor histidine kinase [Nitzschia inconspicua]